jgi:hypothetical protein
MSDVKEVGRKTGRDIYPGLPDKDKAGIPFGVIPDGLIKDAAGRLRILVGLTAASRFSLQDDPDWVRHFAETVNERYVDLFLQGFIIGLVDAAKAEGVEIKG